jgi:metallophosphoesterase (TIGR00282 family)
MRLLFLGDIIGRVGRKALSISLPALKERMQPDLIIANAENAAHGKGLTPRIAEELWDAGIHVLTLGNHSFDKKDILPLLDDPRVIRPANYPIAVPGHGSGVFSTKSGIPVGVIQLMGRVYMPQTDCPFQKADAILKEMAPQAKMIFVDMHAEITSEKAAMGWYLDGRVSAVIGSHTHIQTADERLFPNGTAFLTDVGACGPHNSIIGMDVRTAMNRFLTGIISPMVIAEGDAVICGCLIDIDERTGRANSIARVRESVPVPPL